MTEPQKTQRFHREMLPVLVAFILAMAIIITIDKYILESYPHHSDKNLIIFLEISVMILVFSSYILAEILKALQFLVSILRGATATIEFSKEGVFILFVALVISFSIYCSITYLIPIASS